MRQIALLVFFLIVFGIHLLVNWYIYHRGIQGLEGSPQLKIPFRLMMLFLVVSYPLGRFLEKLWISPISDLFHWSGAFWFAGMLYSTLLILSFDIVRIADHFFHFLPQSGTPDYLALKTKVTLIASFTVLGIIVAGFLNAWHPRIANLHITIHKDAGTMKQLKIVAASDVHMGTIIARRKTAKLVRTINGFKPDIILFAGDVVDEDVQPVIRQNLGDSLVKLKAPLGVYAITGNHEYIGGVEKAVSYLGDHGIKILRDSMILIDDAFYLIGREDRDKTRFEGNRRKELTELIASTDNTKPIILLDHQPFELEKSEQAGIDLQLSGHTHHGQLWPLNWITNRIFEVSRGYKRKGQSHIYVSTGFGTWGPPVRIGHRPEIVVIDVTFDPHTRR